MPNWDQFLQDSYTTVTDHDAANLGDQYWDPVRSYWQQQQAAFEAQLVLQNRADANSLLIARENNATSRANAQAAAKSSGFNTVASQGFLDDETADQAIGRFDRSRLNASRFAEDGGVDAAEWGQTMGRFNEAGDIASGIARDGVLSAQQITDLSANAGRQVMDQVRGAAASAQQGAVSGQQGGVFAASALMGRGAESAGKAIADTRSNLTFQNAQTRLDGLGAATSNASAASNAQLGLGQNRLAGNDQLTQVAGQEAGIDTRRSPTWAQSILEGGPLGVGVAGSADTGTETGTTGTNTGTGNGAQRRPSNGVRRGRQYQTNAGTLTGFGLMG